MFAPFLGLYSSSCSSSRWHRHEIAVVNRRPVSNPVLTPSRSDRTTSRGPGYQGNGFYPDDEISEKFQLTSWLKFIFSTCVSKLNPVEQLRFESVTIKGFRRGGKSGRCSRSSRDRPCKRLSSPFSARANPSITSAAWWCSPGENGIGRPNENRPEQDVELARGGKHETRRKRAWAPVWEKNDARRG